MWDYSCHDKKVELDDLYLNLTRAAKEAFNAETTGNVVDQCIENCT